MKKISLIFVFLLVIFLYTKSGVSANDLNSFLNNLQQKEKSAGAKLASVKNKDEKSNINNVSNLGSMIKNQERDRFVKYVKVRILDKMIGKSYLVEKKLGQSYEVKNLEFKFIVCWKSRPDELPEEKLLLKIVETNEENNTKKTIFYGWIFSSSPSLNSFENEFYDINLVSCKND